jgi:hypothetical protein
VINAQRSFAAESNLPDNLPTAALLALIGTSARTQEPRAHVHRRARRQVDPAIGERVWPAPARRGGALSGHAIVSGQIAPGEKLTGEIANAEALDVSRSAYREAVQVLTAKGLVESRPKAGTRVLPRSRWNILDPQVLAWAFSAEPDLSFVRDLFELGPSSSPPRPASPPSAATRTTSRP